MVGQVGALLLPRRRFAPDVKGSAGRPCPCPASGGGRGHCVGDACSQAAAKSGSEKMKAEDREQRAQMVPTARQKPTGSNQ